MKYEGIENEKTVALNGVEGINKEKNLEKGGSNKGRNLGGGDTANQFGVVLNSARLRVQSWPKREGIDNRTCTNQKMAGHVFVQGGTMLTD